MTRPGRLLERLDRVLELAERALREWLGVGPGPAELARSRAFRWDASRGAGRPVPVAEPGSFDLDDLIGVDRALERLVRNTEQFVRGLPFNHVLLYGERGTGKSSAVKGLLQRFADRGLRGVELRRDDLGALPEVLALLRRWPHPVLLFCDDLSFSEGEGAIAS